jgi:hypothetical protein
MEENQTPEIGSNVETLTLYSPNHPFDLSLRIRNFDNQKDFIKFAKNCELLIRKCVEYKLWKNYITDILHHTSCVVTDESMDELTVEIHHHIPTLFILVKSIINKYITEEKEFSSFDIALDAIKIHFQNKIGYVPIISSMHEKFHNGFLAIPINLVKGNYTQFLNEFGRFLEIEDIDIIDKRMLINESNCNWARDNYIQQSN